MKKHTEKQPVDDLFARKLENMSLPPSPGGFARLQARMGQVQPQARLVFWRNPDIQRYMALAACLLLACLFGWLYLSNDTIESGQKNTVAVNKPTVSSEQKRINDVMANKSASEVATIPPTQEREVEKQIGSEPASGSRTESNQLAFDQSAKGNSQVIRKVQPARTTNEADQNVPAIVSVKPVEQLAKADSKSPSAESTPEKKVESTVASATTKPAPISERVLVVTIAEPEALVAARQAVKTQSDDKATEVVAMGADKAEKATLWQQMKRLKQGEVFARKDAGEDERGLIGRAYSGIKQTLDKEKSVKQ